MSAVPIDPYATPQAVTSAARPRAGPVKAVLVGFAVDVGGTFVSGMLLSLGYGLYLASLGIGTQPSTSWLSFAGYVTGSASSILGGYVCTRIAQRTDYKLGFILGVLSSVTGLLLSFGQYSLPVNIGFTVLTFICVMVGTRFGIVTGSSDQSQGPVLRA